jgi:hypothetical protein
MRRAGRSWRNRDGAYPLLIIGPDEPAGLIIAGIIARWAWRHRSAFLPFTVTASVFAVAAYIHPHHARWWITMACVTVFGAVLLGIPHRLLWTRPAGQFTAGFVFRVVDLAGGGKLRTRPRRPAAGQHGSRSPDRQRSATRQRPADEAPGRCREPWPGRLRQLPQVGRASPRGDEAQP